MKTPHRRADAVSSYVVVLLRHSSERRLIPAVERRGIRLATDVIKVKKINSVQKSPGFTLFEVVFVTALLITLFSITILSFYSILKRDELSSSTQELLSTIKEAQVKTLSGTTVDNQNPSNFGVYFESQKYTLFEGQGFSPDNPNNNPPKDLPSSIVFSQINLPDSQIVFEKVTGQVKSFDENQNSLITKNNANNQIKTITINKFGVINVE